MKADFIWLLSNSIHKVLQLSQSHPSSDISHKSRSLCADKGGQKLALPRVQLQVQQTPKDFLTQGEGLGLFHIFCRRTFVRVCPQHTWWSMNTSLGCSLPTRPVGQRFHSRTSLFPCYGFCNSVLTVECIRRGAGEKG